MTLDQNSIGEIKGVVLIVEDNVKLAELNRKILEKAGCFVLIANTLAEARCHLKLTSPDLVILDLMLPDGSGFDLMTEINESENGARVIFLTARREKKYIIQGLEAGGIDYIKKPYDISEFRLRVMNSLATVCELRNRKPLPVSEHQLTKRELTIARLAANGMSNKEIANEIYITEGHVKNSLTDIYRKLDISDCRDKRKKLGEIFGDTL